MAPLRSWKELFLGERALKPKRPARLRRRFAHNGFDMTTSHVAVGE
jgi:hypothetical protein